MYQHLTECEMHAENMHILFVCFLNLHLFEKFRKYTDLCQYDW